MGKNLVIIRGLPGSGKSTLAKGRFKTYKHVEADMFFVDQETGQYRFDHTRIKDAHAWCFDQVRTALVTHGNCVLSNTFTQKWELQPYLDLVSSMGYTYEIIVCTGEFGNIHDVPDYIVAAMKARWEDIE